MSNLEIVEGLSNQRPQKKEIGNVLIAKTTSSQCTLSSSATQSMGLTAGDYVFVAKLGDGNHYIMKGQGGDKEATPAIKKQGSKLAWNGGSIGSDTSFSSANVWDFLEGNNEENRYFSVLGLETEEEIEQAPTVSLLNGETVKVFAIQFDKVEAKTARKAKTKETSDVETTINSNDANQVSETSYEDDSDEISM